MKRSQDPEEKTKTKANEFALAPLLYDETAVRVLRTLRRAVRPRLSQDAAAGAMGLTGGQRRNAIWDWETGRDRPAAERRWDFARYLCNTLRLRDHPWRFFVIWDYVAVRQWMWPPLDEQFLERAFGDDMPPKLREWCARAAEPHSAVPAPPTPTRVPSTPDFVGRDAEKASYNRQLKSRGMALIIGMAGVGKTALAAYLAWPYASQGKAFWHQFGPGHDINTVLWQLAGFLHDRGQREPWRRVQTAVTVGGPRSVAESCLETCLQALEGHDYLLCFDDFHWVADDPEINNLIRRLADAPVRNRLPVIIAGRRGPHVFEALDAQPLAGLVRRDTQRLLERHLRNPDPNDVARLHEQLDGNPALLMLAINALNASGNKLALLDQLDRAQFLNDFLLSQVDADLTAEVRGVMDALALLGGSATAAQIEAVAEGPGTRDALNELYGRLLLRRAEDQLHGQYTQHDLVRDFYRERPSREVRARLHVRAGDYFERVERDHLAAASHYLAGEQYERSARLLTRDVWQYIYAGQMGPLSELLKRFRQADLEPPMWAAVNLALGQVQAFRREVASARLCFETAYVAACDLAPGRETALLKARASRGLAELLRSTEPEEAVGWAERGLAELAPYEEPPAPPVPLRLVRAPGAEIAREWADLCIQGGYAKVNAADFEGAIEMLKAGLARLPAGPDPLRTAGLINLGVAYCTKGDSGTGMAYYEQALELAKQTGDLWRILSIRHNKAIELEYGGDWITAEQEYKDAIKQAEAIPARAVLTDLANSLGILYTKQGNFAAAEAQLAAAERMAREYDLGRELVASLSSYADLLLRKGDVDGAAERLAKAQTKAEAMKAADQLAEIDWNWALVHLARGASPEALAAVERSLACELELGLTREQGISLRVKGEVLAALGRTDEACAAFEASVALLEGYDRYEAARTKLAWGQELLAHAVSPAGAELVRSAELEFERLGVRTRRD